MVACEQMRKWMYCRNIHIRETFGMPASLQSMPNHTLQPHILSTTCPHLNKNGQCKTPYECWHIEISLLLMVLFSEQFRGRWRKEVFLTQKMRCVWVMWKLESTCCEIYISLTSSSSSGGQRHCSIYVYSHQTDSHTLLCWMITTVSGVLHGRSPSNLLKK